jgi:lysozyme family protein
MKTDSKFEAAVELVLKHEGGYVNDPADPGGETNFGISKRSYPKLDIKKLSRAEAVEIYRNDWWIRHNYRHIFNETLAAKVFDIAVNVGAARANRWLQGAAGALGSDIMIDGVVGPKTLMAVNTLDAAALLGQFMRAAYRHYRWLGQRMPTFEKGWIDRLLNQV